MYVMYLWMTASVIGMICPQNECLSVIIFRREFKGQHDRGNRTESLWEGNLPLRGSLRGPVRGRLFRDFSEVLRGFQRLLEVLRGFRRFSEVFRGFKRLLRGFQRFLRGFQRFSQRPSQRQISLSEALGPVAPIRVAPWTFAKFWILRWRRISAVLDCRSLIGPTFLERRGRRRMQLHARKNALETCLLQPPY